MGAAQSSACTVFESVRRLYRNGNCRNDDGAEATHQTHIDFRFFDDGYLPLVVYFLFLPDVALSQMWIPYMLQGVGVGVLFVPLVLNTVSAVPAYLAPFAGAIGVAGRFWGTNIGFCLVQNFQVYFINKHRYIFLEKLLPENPTTTGIVSTIQESFVQKGYDLAPAATLAMKKVNAGVQTQSFLLGNMELFTVWGYGLFLVALYIAFNKHLRFSFNLLKNKYFS
jgi:hypothetical protein